MGSPDTLVDVCSGKLLRALRGLLRRVVLVWLTESGRAPGAGRRHLAATGGADHQPVDSHGARANSRA